MFLDFILLNDNWFYCHFFLILVENNLYKAMSENSCDKRLWKIGDDI